MKGLELSKAFFERFGLPMILNEFSEYSDRIAAGLVGHGSECFGFDDEISSDHDFEPGFCLWITDEDDGIFGFRLMRAYSKLPKEFEGISIKKRSLLGSDGKGVHTISDFYKNYTGCSEAPRSWREWMSIPSHYLAEAVNGEVFYDPMGVFSKIRKDIKSGMPRDVRLKKIAARAVIMAQTGQYNYSRCISHGEMCAAELAMHEFAKETVQMVFLLNGEHCPYYKWMFRAMRSLVFLSDISEDLERLLLDKSGNFKKRENIIEEICAKVVSYLQKAGLSDSYDAYLESHAFSVNSRIKNAEIRNLHIMEG